MTATGVEVWIVMMQREDEAINDGYRFSDPFLEKLDAEAYKKTKEESDTDFQMLKVVKRRTK